MKDFLNNELNIGDLVVINQNTLTGSSTTRKILKRAVVENFTKKMVITNKGYINPDNVIKIFIENDQQIKQLKEME